MRDTSVYLMAEHTGNKETRDLYRDKLVEYVRMLYNVGMMEWDSCNYLNHTLAPYHNLYDFAKDPEVRRLAKAALDWLYCAGAIKYWRGGLGGPNNRDYGSSNVVFGGGAVQPLYLYFGDAPAENPTSHCDDVYHITSAYRPPAAVVNVARKKFKRPVELRNTKPFYRIWKPGDEVEPRYWETVYYGKTFQLGTAVSKEPMKPWTPRMFKMLAYSEKRGVDFVLSSLVPPDGHAEKVAGDQIAQYNGLVIRLIPAGETKRSFYFQVPKTAKCNQKDNWMSIMLDKTAIVVMSMGLSEFKDYELEQYKGKPDKKGKRKVNKNYELYKDQRFLRAESKGDKYAGFAMAVLEVETLKSPFKVSMDISGLDRGVVTLKGACGRTLTLRHNPENDLPIIERDRKPFDYARRLDVYSPLEGEAPVLQKYKSGTLRVEAGGEIFTCTVDNDGKVEWKNEN
jgi:hypothetical protein